ncbi:hypothetical protein ACFC18_52860 [Streptomyces sp. NPDC056121]|uniref:hypothetical protein n=1 Tax=Streptomyces sp. NPDC056121 TaxID=3345718 RepID=UPI0035E2637B
MFIQWHRDAVRDPQAPPQLFEDWETKTLHAHGWRRAPYQAAPPGPPAPRTLRAGLRHVTREDLDAVCNVGVEVRLAADGSRWSATVFTLAEVERLMKRWSPTGEELGGRCFWCSDGLVVRDPGIDNMTQVLVGLLDAGDFTQVLQRLDDE